MFRVFGFPPVPRDEVRFPNRFLFCALSQKPLRTFLIFGVFSSTAPHPIEPYRCAFVCPLCVCLSGCTSLMQSRSAPLLCHDQATKQKEGLNPRKCSNVLLYPCALLYTLNNLPSLLHCFDAFKLVLHYYYTKHIN